MESGVARDGAALAREDGLVTLAIGGGVVR